MNSKKIKPDWKKNQAFIQRQNKMMSERLLSDPVGGKITASIQVNKVKVQPSTNYRRTRHAREEQKRSDPAIEPLEYLVGEPSFMLPQKDPDPPGKKDIPAKDIPSKDIPAKNIPTKDIPAKDIRFQINWRADAVCPSPPPNTPPPTSRRTIQYRCGDFTYHIPGDDSFVRELFIEPTQCRDDVPSEPQVVLDGKLWRQFASALPPLPPGMQRHSNDSRRNSKDRGIRNQVSNSAIKFDECFQHSPRRVPEIRYGNRMTRKSVSRDEFGQRSFADPRSPRVAGSTRSHSDLGFVPSPRIAKFLEEIRIAKEQREAAAAQRR